MGYFVQKPLLICSQNHIEYTSFWYDLEYGKLLQLSHFIMPAGMPHLVRTTGKERQSDFVIRQMKFTLMNHCVFSCMKINLQGVIGFHQKQPDLQRSFCKKVSIVTEKLLQKNSDSYNTYSCCWCWLWYCRIVKLNSFDDLVINVYHLWLFNVWLIAPS